MALVALACIVALTGCTKAPPAETVTPASDSNGAAAYDPTPTPAPESPPPSTTPPSSPPPTQPTPSTTPTPTANATPASTPPDFKGAKAGWVVANSQTDPNATIRLIFPVQFGAKNVTIRASDAMVTPAGDHAASPFTIKITDPLGRSVGPNATRPVDAVPVSPPDAPSGPEPQTRTIELNASAWRAGEYTVTLTISPAVAGDGSNFGERYQISVYVHY